ncbi:TonB-dependent receptor [Pseudomonas bohemica]|uniref:TonB-dependent receptor n=1 Tax=Pseudomonas bohemica TaxID=2044872 RepID=UPI000DA5ED38|nr:TonB-dependent receptor [Pseudomonas bohemica]
MPSTFTPALSDSPRTTNPLALSLLTVAVLAAGLHSAPAAAAEQSARVAGSYQFSIKQQPLVSALNEFSQATGWQVGMSSDLARNVTSPGVSGTLSAEQALDQLLAGSNLSYRRLGNNNVVLEKRSTSGTLALEQVTVSATRQAQSVDSVPSTVTVHERTELDRANVNNIRDLVRYEPGVSVGGAGQRAGTSDFNIRGIDGDRILTQVDGVEVPDTYFSGPYANTHRNYVDPEIIKRVEILRGPASALYGSSAIGGAVSYYTLDPEDIIKPGQYVGARLKTGYSSADNSWLNSATVAGREGDFDGLLHVSQRNGRETESYGEHGGTGLSRTAANPEDARATNVLAKLGWNYGDNDRLAFTYEKYKDDTHTNQKSAVGGPFIPGRGASGMYRSREGNDVITRERFGLENTFALNSLLADNVKWSLNYQIAKTDQDTLERYVPGSRDVWRTRDTTYKERQWIFDAQLDKAFNIADTEHLLTYGTTLKQQKVTGLRSGSGTCAAVLGTCRTVGAPSASDLLLPNSDFPDPTVNTYALFAQDQIKWGDWTFTPGARYDYTTLDPHATEAFLRAVSLTSADQFDDKEKKWHRLSPKLGVTYAISDAYTWYGQYAEGFRTPSAKALYGRFENRTTGYIVEPNPNLEPEKSRSYETGLRGRFDEGSFDVAVFYNKYRDFINEDAIQPASSNEAVFQANNIRHATIKGVEVKGRLNLDSFGAPQGLYTQGSLAYLYGRNEDTGQPINSVNPLTGVFGLGYEQDNYGGLLSWTLVKRKTRVDNSNFHAPDGSSSQFKTPGFGLVDLTGFYKVTEDVTLSGGLYNLADKRYWLWDDVRGYDGVGEAGVTAPASLDRLTQPGRNFAINVAWDI